MWISACDASITAKEAERAVPEMERGYPEPYLFGILPSWGLFARHVANLEVRGIELVTRDADERPGVVLDDVENARFSNVELRSLPARPTWSLKNVRGLRTLDVTGLPDGDLAAAAGRSSP